MPAEFHAALLRWYDARSAYEYADSQRRIAEERLKTAAAEMDVAERALGEFARSMRAPFASAPAPTTASYPMRAPAQPASYVPAAPMPAPPSTSEKPADEQVLEYLQAQKGGV
jgi:hypothetical protein